MTVLGGVQELLCSAAAAPSTAVARLRLITPPEAAQVLRSFNAWDLPYTRLLDPEQQTIHGMFEHWAEHTPQAPALTFGVRWQRSSSPQGPCKAVNAKSANMMMSGRFTPEMLCSEFLSLQ